MRNENYCLYIFKYIYLVLQFINTENTHAKKNLN